MNQSHVQLVGLHRGIREKNRQLNQWEQFYRKVHLESFPVTIQFPTGTRCNLRCRFCTERQGPGVGQDYRDLTFAEYRKILERGALAEAFCKAAKVALYGWGEPLFNRDYESIFDYTAENFPGMGLGICTNGVMFTPKWAEKIIAVPHSDVNFSVNAAGKDTFRKLTGSAQFERVVAHIRRLTGLRGNGGTPNPYVSLSFVATTANIRELADFVDLAADLKADSVLIQDIMLLNEETGALSLMNAPGLARRMFQTAERRARERKILFHSFVTHQVDYFLPEAETPSCIPAPPAAGQEIPSPYFSPTDCFDPWERMMISDDGRVFPCCRFQTLPGTSMGNILSQGLQEIWNGPAYHSLRRTINTDRPPSVCAICARKAGLDR